MPIVRIDIQAGKSTAYKRDILHSTRSAMTLALGIADERIMQRIVETPAENIDATDIQSDRLTIIEISMLPGRPAPQLQAMYAEMVSALGERPGIHHNDITIYVHEPQAECFTIGGVMQCMLPGAVPNEDDDTSLAEESVDTAIVGIPSPAAEPEPWQSFDEAPPQAPAPPTPAAAEAAEDS